MATLLKIDEALKQDVEGLDHCTPTRQRLLDLATVLTLVTHGLERCIGHYGDMAGSEDDAAEAERILRKVKASTLWLQAYRDVAAEDELCNRIITARREAMRTLLVVRRMELHHRKVWDHLQKFHRQLSSEQNG